MTKFESKPMFVHEHVGYNPVVDLYPVSPNDGITLQEAFVTGSIPDSVELGQEQYDGCEDPRAIVGRPANEFEAIHMTQTLKDYASQSGSPDKKD